MAEPMTYDFILRDKKDATKKIIYPLSGEESVCWYRLIREFEETHKVAKWLEGDEEIIPVLDALIYYFDNDNMDIHAVRKVMEMLFDNDPHGVQWEVVNVDKEVNGHPCRMFLTNMEAMPRGLFMQKMFCVRNLIRDEASTKCFNMLLGGGVPFNIAAFFGAGLEYNDGSGWGDNQPYVTLKEYAGFIERETPHFAHAIRSAANGIYCEQKSLPWSEGWGYNRLNKDNGGFHAGRWPSEICDSLINYPDGDDLPEGIVSGNLWEMDEDTLTKLMRFICKDENIIIKFPTN